jgi:histidinol-phosphate aminotransferase
VSDGMIATGCGSDGILDATIRAFGNPGDLMAMAVPTFPMAAAFARLNGLRVNAKPLTATLELPLRELVAGDPSIIYVCAPNNPTGTPVGRSAIERLVEMTNALVIVDEAYFEFSGHTVVDLLARSRRLVIARTLSKAFGLAGLRVGYAVAHAELIALIERSRGPYAVSGLAERASVAAIRDDQAWMRDRVALALASVRRLTDALRGRGLDVPASVANFVFVPLLNARRVTQRMRDDGIAVRAFEGLPCCSPGLVASDGGALRITAAPDVEIDAALDALDRARAACA